jgi:hypothetical protein
MTTETTVHPPKMPFGQYKGQCAGCVAKHDQQYAQWCLAQEGLQDRYPEVCAFWLNLGVKPLAYCHVVKKDGNPCELLAKEGPFCRNHYRHAERAMMATIEAMDLESVT